MWRAEAVPILPTGGRGHGIFQRQQKPWCSLSIFMPSTYIKLGSWSTYGVPSPYNLLNGQPVAHLQNFFIGQPIGISSPFILFIGQPAIC